jgi:hypothetical protein
MPKPGKKKRPLERIKREVVQPTGNSDHLQNVECFNCGKKGHYSTDCSLPKKNTQSANMVSKEDFKNLFQTSMKEMFTKKDKKAKNNAEGDDDSLDINVF